jgi:hypothetical protein
LTIFNIWSNSSSLLFDSFSLLPAIRENSLKSFWQESHYSWYFLSVMFYLLTQSSLSLFYSEMNSVSVFCCRTPIAVLLV